MFGSSPFGATSPTKPSLHSSLEDTSSPAGNSSSKREHLIRRRTGNHEAPSVDANGDTQMLDSVEAARRSATSSSGEEETDSDIDDEVSSADYASSDDPEVASSDLEDEEEDDDD